MYWRFVHQQGFRVTYEIIIAWYLSNNKKWTRPSYFGLVILYLFYIILKKENFCSNCKLSVFAFLLNCAACDFWLSKSFSKAICLSNWIFGLRASIYSINFLPFTERGVFSPSTSPLPSWVGYQEGCLSEGLMASPYLYQERVKIGLNLFPVHLLCLAAHIIWGAVYLPNCCFPLMCI